MGQFRDTADIADEVLQKAGEPVNGTSPYEGLVLTYLNKAQQALVAGGSIFSLKVDEVWSWARSRYPMVLELEPPYATGTVSLINNDIGITFSDAPTYSLQGWTLMLTNRQTTYRITAHDAGQAVAVLDSGVTEPTGLYGFRAYKTDYELVPQYLYVDASNDRLDFEEDAGVPLMAQLDRGTYTAASLLAHVISKLNLVGTTGAYSGTYDPDTRHYFITSTLAGGNIFSLLGATGTNRKRSALPLLGFDRLDYAGAGTYESTYATNGVSRLVEPFRVFARGTACREITSTDLVSLNHAYPFGYYSGEGTPTEFARVHESYDGTVTVRFNCFPRERTKVLVDWVPVPIDLQDHDGSVPVVPRKEIDVLIHAAAAFIAFDKEDDKLADFMKLTEAQILAMEKKQRAEDFRTGENYGQIVTRQDQCPSRKLRYGYPWNPGSSATTDPANVPASTTYPFTFPYTAFQDLTAQKSFTVRVLPANHTLFAIIVKHSVAFAGGGITQLLLDVGIDGDPTKFINGFDLMQTVSPTASESVLTVYFPAQSKEIKVRATATGDNLSALTQGSLTMYFQESVIGAGI